MISLSNLNSDTVGRFLFANQRRLVTEEEVNRMASETAQWVAHFQGQKLDIPTASGIEAFHFAGIDPYTQQKVRQSDKTVILFGGMSSYQHHYSWLMEKYVQRGINVVTLNYRGVGGSGANGEVANKPEIVQDGMAIVDYLESHFHVPRDHLAVHGHSLGGGFSALVAAERPGIHAVNERSYSKLSHASHPFIKGFLASNQIAIDSLPSDLSVSNLATLAFQSTNWEIDTEAAWRNIQGKRCVVCHLKDPVISKEVSLYQSIYAQDQKTTYLVLDDDCPNPHGRLLSDQEIDTIVQAIHFKRPAPEPIPDPVPLPISNPNPVLSHPQPSPIISNQPSSPLTGRIKVKPASFLQKLKQIISFLFQKAMKFFEMAWKAVHPKMPFFRLKSAQN